MKQVLLLVVLLLFLAYVVAVVFSGFDASMMSIHGWIALGLGTVLSLALGIGLMGAIVKTRQKEPS